MSSEDAAAAKGLPCDLVCEGGGVKGIGLAGAYETLERAGYVPRHAAGTSAGAITAALIAAGYSATDLKNVVFGMDYSGRDAAARFLRTWDVDAYVAEYRRGKEHHRRDDIVADLRQAKGAGPAPPPAG